MVVYPTMLEGSSDNTAADDGRGPQAVGVRPQGLGAQPAGHPRRALLQPRQERRAAPLGLHQRCAPLPGGGPGRQLRGQVPHGTGVLGGACAAGAAGPTPDAQPADLRCPGLIPGAPAGGAGDPEPAGPQGSGAAEAVQGAGEAVRAVPADPGGPWRPQAAALLSTCLIISHNQSPASSIFVGIGGHGLRKVQLNRHEIRLDGPGPLAGSSLLWYQLTVQEVQGASMRPSLDFQAGSYMQPVHQPCLIHNQLYHHEIRLDRSGPGAAQQ